MRYGSWASASRRWRCSLRSRRSGSRRRSATTCMPRRSAVRRLARAQGDRAAADAGSGVAATSDAPDGPRRTTCDAGRRPREARACRPTSRCSSRSPRGTTCPGRRRPESVDAVFEAREEEPLVGEGPRIGSAHPGERPIVNSSESRRCTRSSGTAGGPARWTAGEERPLVEEAEADLVVAPEDVGRARSREPVRRPQVDVPVVVSVAAPDDVAFRHGLARRPSGSSNRCDTRQLPRRSPRTAWMMNGPTPTFETAAVNWT